MTISLDAPDGSTSPERQRRRRMRPNHGALYQHHHIGATVSRFHIHETGGRDAQRCRFGGTTRSANENTVAAPRNPGLSVGLPDELPAIKERIRFSPIRDNYRFRYGFLG